MIHLINREQALQHTLLADFIAMIQAHQIDGELEFSSSKEEEKSIRKIYDVAGRYAEGLGNKVKERVFYHPEDDISLYPSMLSNSLSRFFRADKVLTFFVLPHLKLSLIGEQDNGISSLRDAQQLLYRATGNRNYDEAFSVDPSSFDEMIQALFWLVRYDATIPEYVFISPENADYFISVSKHGSLYFYISEEEEFNVVSKAQDAGLVEWNQVEFERFTGSSVIEGRFTDPE